MGPAVTCTSPRFRKFHKEPFSFSAQISVWLLRDDWKAKYFPSGAQFPQHSAGGSFHPGNKGRGLVPSAKASHSDVEFEPGSRTVNRSTRPSGAQRGQKGMPGTVTSFRMSPPSAFASYKLDPLA